MSIGYRIFVVHEDQTIEALSQKSFDAFYLRNEPALPHFANRAITLAVVLYRLRDRRPEQICRIDSHRLHVTVDGALDQERCNDAIQLSLNRADWGALPDAKSSIQGSVIDASARFEERRHAQYYPQLSGTAMGYILQALFGRSER